MSYKLIVRFLLKESGLFSFTVLTPPYTVYCTVGISVLDYYLSHLIIKFEIISPDDILTITNGKPEM